MSELDETAAHHSQNGNHLKKVEEFEKGNAIKIIHHENTKNSFILSVLKSVVLVLTWSGTTPCY
jgi:hypothetical protein